MKLHETIKNFYISRIKPLLNIEVLADNGTWNKIDSLNITDKQYFYKIKTLHYELLCTKNHIVIDQNNNEILAIESLNKCIFTDTGIERVISVEKTSIFDNAYDLSLANNTSHLYYCNGILSHNCVCIDEMAFIPKNIIDEFFASVMPVVSSAKNSKVIAVSTPNGTSGLYYDIWKAANSKDAKSNKEGWKPFRIDWWEVPGRTQEWKEKQIASIGIDKWNQEFGNEFITASSMQKLIPDDIIEKLRMKLSEYKLTNELNGKQQHIESQDKTKTYEFTMWHEFKPDKTYLASADVAEGSGGDSSILYVWDITNISQLTLCCKFDSQTVSTIEFAFITDRILKLYGNPWLACESNGIGSGYIDSLRVTYNYQNIIREGKDGKFGITSHVQVKGKACIWLKEMFTTYGIAWKIYDKDIIDEMGTFIKKDSKMHIVYNAMAGTHDDHIMALCWAAWIINPDIIESYYRVATTFTTVLEKILPQRIEPYDEYTVAQIDSICNDPLHKEFIEYKEQMFQKLKQACQIENAGCKKDLFKYKNSFDMTFFGDTDDCAEWGNPYIMSYNENMSQTASNMLNQKKPIFVVNTGIL